MDAPTKLLPLGLQGQPWPRPQDKLPQAGDELCLALAVFESFLLLIPTLALCLQVAVLMSWIGRGILEHGFSFLVSAIKDDNHLKGDKAKLKN